jgi:hypothetical protein
MAIDNNTDDAPSIDGFHVEAASNSVVLTWPSDPRESFVVLWRSNANDSAQWIILTNQMRAASNSRQTILTDINGLNRFSENEKTNLARLYAVHVIPDFWFDMHGLTANGRAGQDFIPFYNGTETTGIFEPQTWFLFDGKDSYDCVHDIKRVNFGTPKNPRWIYVTGFLFTHGNIANGDHTLQIRSTLAQNRILGEGTQDLLLTNKLVQIRISSKASDENWFVQQIGHDYILTDLPTPARPFSLKEVQQSKSDFQLDLGEVSHYIKITPEYSNAVLKAVLPIFSDSAEKLGLPVPKPISQNDINKFTVQPFRELTAFLLLNNGWVFEYSFGGVRYISNLRSYAALQDPDEIPRYYGKVKMTQTEAVQMARNTLVKLGIPLEDVFAEQEPHVTPPPHIDGTNIVPHYEIKWITPRAGEATSVDIHINAETKQIERIYISNKNLGHPLKINVVPISAPLGWPSVNPEYARQLIPQMLKAIDEYGHTLSLPIPRSLTTNNVARIEIHDNEGWPHAEIWLTNGWHFIYRHTMVNGYDAPGNLFSSDDRLIHIRDFEGQWNLTTNQAIEIVRQALKKLDYPTNNVHMEDAKTFIYTAAVNREHIPRLNFQWYYETNDELQSRLEAEVNTDSGKLESLYYDDKACWNSRPPIDVPISIKN